MASLSRLSASTGYLTGIALSMVLYGAAHGLALSGLTTQPDSVARPVRAPPRSTKPARV